MLNGEIMERYRLAKDWRSAGFYETENHRQIRVDYGRVLNDTPSVGVLLRVLSRPSLSTSAG